MQNHADSVYDNHVMIMIVCASLAPFCQNHIQIALAHFFLGHFLLAARPLITDDEFAFI